MSGNMFYLFVILGLALGHSPRRMFSTSASKERLKQRAKADVAESAQTVANLDV